MKIRYDKPSPPFVKLRSVLDNYEIYPDQVFEFENRVYCRIGNSDSAFTQLHVTGGLVPIFNLKSRTIRAVSPDIDVVPLECEVIVSRIT